MPTCLKHRGHDLERNGTCSRCDDPAQALLRLRAAVQPKLRTPIPKRPPGPWWMGKLKQYAQEQSAARGQESLPPGDRS